MKIIIYHYSTRISRKKQGPFLKKCSTQKTILTLNKDIIETATDLLSNLDAGEYYISMAAKSTKANASGSVFYNVTATFDMANASALADVSGLDNKLGMQNGGLLA